MGTVLLTHSIVDTYTLEYNVHSRAIGQSLVAWVQGILEGTQMLKSACPQESAFFFGLYFKDQKKFGPAARARLGKCSEKQLTSPSFHKSNYFTSTKSQNPAALKNTRIKSLHVRTLQGARNACP